MTSTTTLRTILPLSRDARSQLILERRTRETIFDRNSLHPIVSFVVVFHSAPRSHQTKHRTTGPILEGAYFSPAIRATLQMVSNSSRSVCFLVSAQPIAFLTVIFTEWANARGFPPKSTPPGIDPIIGQLNPGDVLPRSMSGTNPASQDELLGLPIWVVPRGGEYFFSPSISALRDTFALGVHIH